MKMRLLALLAVATILLLPTGCGEETPSTNLPEQTVSNVYKDETYGFQQELPEKGDQVVIMHTSMGDVSIRLFPEAAPKAVKNFTTHAKNGYYNGLTFHRVIQDFMIQGGDPDGDGTGGDSIWNEDFEDEFDQKLMNIRGSLAMANSGVNTNGSQFFINQGGPSGDTVAQMKANYDIAGAYEQYAAYYGDQFTAQYPTKDSFVEANLANGTTDIDLVPDEVWDLYAQVGGNIHLDGAWRHVGGHTVFGHVYAGMDVVDKIAAVDVDSETNAPKEKVTITSMEVTTY